MPDVYLIRHAPPAVRGVFLGRLDPPLDPDGIAPARLALGGLHCEAVYASPLRRARETAALIPGHPCAVILEDLVELGLGEWDGVPWQEIERRWPLLARRKAADWLGVTPPGGESWDDLLRRAARALETVRGGPLPAAVVAHQAVNAALAQLIAGRDPLSFQQQYCEVIPCDL
jgi:broad specificity phosphatase PhoE